MKQENVFFTSDHHFGHGNIIKYSERLEFASPYEAEVLQSGDSRRIRELKISRASIEQMTEGMIQRWNSVVPPSGLVYHLGDMFLTNSVEDAIDIRNRLNGRIRYIVGNHDKIAKKMRQCFDSFDEIDEIKIEDSSAREGEQSIVLCHYAMRVWNKSHHGTWMLYGHSHGSLPDDPHALSFDVGVDCHNYTPLSYSRVKEIISKKTFKPIDHHRGVS